METAPLVWSVVPEAPMAGILTPLIVSRIRRAVDSWNSGDYAAVLANYADDAQVASVAGGEWMQIGESLEAICAEFAKSTRRIELVDILDGLNHVTVLLHDGRRYFSMTIETDDESRARRVIICRGQKRMQTFPEQDAA